jgi:hypothetical protein
LSITNLTYFTSNNNNNNNSNNNNIRNYSNALIYEQSVCQFLLVWLAQINASFSVYRPVFTYMNSLLSKTNCSRCLLLAATGNNDLPTPAFKNLLLYGITVLFCVTFIFIRMVHNVYRFRMQLVTLILFERGWIAKNVTSVHWLSMSGFASYLLTVLSCIKVNYICLGVKYLTSATNYNV